MIITALRGGLGNQMFAYAAGLALAEQRRTVLKLDVSWFRHYAEFEAHNRYALSCFNITEQFATDEEILRVRGRALSRTERWSVWAARRLRFHRYADALSTRASFHRQPGFAHYDEFAHVPDGTYIDGTWQSERFFAPIANLLRLHFSFRYPAPESVRETGAQIRRGPSVAVHFRRGDYVTNPAFRDEIGVVGFDYYERALELMYARHPGVTAYVFSDDIDAIERQFRPRGPHHFVRATQPWHSYDKIRLMSMCDHAIISNSTFAWWAAWLNPSPRKLVVAPDPWLAGKPQDSRDVVPDGWIRLPHRADSAVPAT